MENHGLGNFWKARFAVLGYPDDLAVKNVNGRLGASEGPGKFFEYLRKLKGEIPVLDSILREGLAPAGPDLEENHAKAADLTGDFFRALHSKRDALLVVGGGHDYAYPWIRGVRNALPSKTRVGCINLDAHFDLRDFRPVMTSGSPFRRLIEEGFLDPDRLVEFGIQNHCNSLELWKYAKDQRIKTIRMEELRSGKAVSRFRKSLSLLKRKVDHVVVSLDLDSISLALAPGVSAPQPEGFNASEIFQMMEIAGADPKVVSLGIFELSPPLDVQDQTSRLAAQVAWKFMHSKLKGKKR
jgi:formiminoglutamase